jgi:RIO kinase 1
VRYYAEHEDDFEYDVPVKARAKPRVPRKSRRRLSHSEMRAEIVEPDPHKIHAAPRPKPSTMESFSKVAEESTEATIGFMPQLLAKKNHISNHEKEWIGNYLGTFYEDNLITEMVRRVRSGKEATVYCCRAHPRTGVDLLAGKVYHERMFRSLKNDSLYREGRDTLDEQGKSSWNRREALALAKKTRFGQDLRHLSWLSAEFRILTELHEAGADVPRPFVQSDNAMLMEFVGDEQVAAPALVNVRLRKEEARPLFDKLVANIELMLSKDIVHGDLSAHNVLYWQGDVKIIDFPQAVRIYSNPFSFSLFSRDVERICQYFSRYGIDVDGKGLAEEMWSRHVPQ